MDRPRIGERQRSNTIIVPKGIDVVQSERPDYPPDDARAMSPRRNSQDIERLEESLRETLKEQARNLQSSLAALAEKIDEVKTDHDKLETENKFLQDYIGGLTRTMSRDNLGRSGSTRSKKKGKR
jgi:short coiled-coil protein